MTADDLVAKTGSAASSVALHLAGALALAVSGSITIIDPAPRFYEVTVAPILRPLRLFAPAPYAAGDDQVSESGRRCSTSTGAASPPMLLWQPPPVEGLRARRNPRLCLRIGADGRVRSAAVLVSSRKLTLDHQAKTIARHLIFKPAYRDGAPTSATVTFDMLGVT